MNVSVHTFCELDFVVVAESHSHWVEYKIYDVEYWDTSGVYDTPRFQRAGAVSHPDVVESTEESEPYISGSVKWDGCSNWKFDEQDRGTMLHGCCRKDVLRYGQILAACWDLTAQLCESWMD